MKFRTALLGVLTAAMAVLALPGTAHAETGRVIVNNVDGTAYTCTQWDAAGPDSGQPSVYHWYGEDEHYACDPLVTQCLEAHPGAVVSTAVTEAADTVCVGNGQGVYRSPGDDTYLWVGGDLDPTSMLWTGGTAWIDPAPNAPTWTADDGYDTMSLADWGSGYTEVFNDNGSGGFFGRSIVDVDAWTTTNYADSVGNPNLCAQWTDGPAGGFDFGLSTGDGDDTVSCFGGNIDAGAGDDTVTGASYGAVVSTGEGNDTVQDVSRQAQVNTGAGDDHIVSIATGVVTTGDGNDDVTGTGGTSTVNTGAGNDLVHDVTGNSAITTGLGDDTVEQVDGSTVTTGDGNDLIEHVDASGVSAGAGADVIRYVTGASTIYGQDGADTITEVDSSTVYAGAGDDTILATDAGAVYGGTGNDLIRNVATDSVASGGTGNDTIVGVSTGSVAVGGAGNDVVKGDAGSDKIVLGTGNDKAYVTNGGADKVSGGTGADVVYASANDIVTSATIK